MGIGDACVELVSLGRAGSALLEQPDLMCTAIPELAAARGFEQRSVYHVYDVYEHTAHVCNACESFAAGLAPLELRWAALLHDIAKPVTFSLDVAGHGHFFCHPIEGARMAQTIMRRLGIAHETIVAACELIRLHDERMPCTALAIRRLLARMWTVSPGREIPLAFALFDLRRADAVSKCAFVASWASKVDDYVHLLREEVASGPVYLTSHLAVDEADVMRLLGTKPGIETDMQMDMLLHAVMESTVRNERDDLVAWLSA